MSRKGLNVLHDLQTMCSLYWLMVRIRPTFVLAYTVKPVVYGMLAALFSARPNRFALVTGLGYAFQDDGRGLSKWLVRLMYQLALRNASKVFFQNPDDENLFRALSILRSSVASTVVNGSGVDLQHYGVLPQPSKIKFLLIARLLVAKGIREYVQAARQIKLKHPDVEFALVGWIDVCPDAISERELQQWINEKVIDYKGRQKDVRGAIADCSVYVLPSYSEGTPRSVLEAMAMGRAIVTTDAPGCRETVRHEENGFLVKVKCVDSLVDALESFIDDPALAERMGRASRQIAEEKYDVRMVNAHMMSEMGI